MTILPKSKKPSHQTKQDRYSQGPSRSHSSQPGGQVPSGASQQANDGVPAQSAAAGGRTKQRKPSSGALSPSHISQLGSPGAVGSRVASPLAGLDASKGPRSRHRQVAHAQHHQPASSSSSSSKSATAISHHHGQEEHNSDDEYGAGFKNDELDLNFAERLKKSRGLIIKEVKGDGACMFRAVADQIYGDEEMHADVRYLCMEYIAKNRDHFSQFITEDFNDYLTRKRELDSHGNHVELQAISEIFARPVEIFEYSLHPINTFHPISPEANAPGGGAEVNAPLRLSYHGAVHYNSVRDPFAATIGVGLGLPEFRPGLADRNLMREATQASEAHHIEEAMLADKIRMTDWERTEEELAKEVAKQSYLDYLHRVEGSDVGGEKTSATGKKEIAKPALGKEGSGSHRSASTSSGLLGSKRGASSPNIPCCSRNTDTDLHGSSPFSSPVAKMHRDEDYSSSLPNIGAESGFGASLAKHQQELMKPSTSAAHLPRLHHDKDVPSSSNPPKPGLYEELLASSALAYYDDEWSGSATALNETAQLAQAIALSQQDFYDSMTTKVKPKKDSQGGGGSDKKRGS